MRNILIWISALCSIITISCKKSDFLDKKPSTDITQPKTLTDFQQLLDNTAVNNYSGALGQISSDDYEVPYTSYQTASETQRNAYIWNKDLYGSDVGIQAWNGLYKEIFYSNIVLEGLSKSDSLNTIKGQNIKGWALFNRAYEYYDLVRNFCSSYDANSANTDLGVPLKLNPGIDELLPRSTIKQTYDQIFSDIFSSLEILPQDRPVLNLNRPSKVAAYALLARIYLDMRDYTQAEKYTDLCLNLYSTIIDYNTVSQTSATPFSVTHNELIYNNSFNGNYAFNVAASIQITRIANDLINLYSPNDLRLKIFYGQLTDGSRYKKRGYNGVGNYGFTGLATDELILIKSECLARRNESTLAMQKLNELLIKRYDKNFLFVPITANSPKEALSKVIDERRKELVWRGLRWHDLKRLNKEGANITLTRILNGVTYNLPPNDPRYIFPIPNDEVSLSGIAQNPR